MSFRGRLLICNNKERRQPSPAFVPTRWPDRWPLRPSTYRYPLNSQLVVVTLTLYSLRVHPTYFKIGWDIVRSCGFSFYSHAQTRTLTQGFAIYFYGCYFASSALAVRAKTAWGSAAPATSQLAHATGGAHESSCAPRPIGFTVLV